MGRKRRATGKVTRPPLFRQVALSTTLALEKGSMGTASVTGVSRFLYFTGQSFLVLLSAWFLPYLTFALGP